VPNPRKKQLRAAGGGVRRQTRRSCKVFG
jgi:hypothetical protein